MAASDDVRRTINESLDRIDKLINKWMLYTINPYSMAYDDALEAFKTKLDEQKEADKAESLALQLAMIALSMCGGGILTAAFGTAALKTVAVDSATKFICEFNMEKAFKAANFISTNKTANFIAGKVWDGVESGASSFISGKVKSAFTQDSASFPSTARLKNMTSFKMSKTLEQFVREAMDKASDLMTALRDSDTLYDVERMEQLSNLEKGSFFNPPTTSVDDGTLSDDLELAFYMNLILDSDYLEVYQKVRTMESDGLARVPVWKTTKYRQNIHESPSSSNYPMKIQGDQDVFYDKIGSKLRDRMNELYKKKMRSKEPILDGKINDRVMLNAERTIGLLASSNIKKRIETVTK